MSDVQRFVVDAVERVMRRQHDEVLKPLRGDIRDLTQQIRKQNGRLTTLEVKREEDEKAASSKSSWLKTFLLLVGGSGTFWIVLQHIAEAMLTTVGGK